MAEGITLVNSFNLRPIDDDELIHKPGLSTCSTSCVDAISMTVSNSSYNTLRFVTWNIKHSCCTLPRSKADDLPNHHLQEVRKPKSDPEAS